MRADVDRCLACVERGGEGGLMEGDAGADMQELEFVGASEGASEDDKRRLPKLG